MLTRVKTIVAIFFCTFLCLFGGAAVAQQQTVLLLSTPGATNQSETGEADYAFKRFEVDANATMIDGRGWLDGNHTTNYTEAFEGLQTGDAVVIVASGTTSIIGDTDLAEIKKMMDEDSHVAFFIFADHNTNSEAGQNQIKNEKESALTNNNVYKLANVVGELADWSDIGVRFRWPNKTKQATDALGEETRYKPIARNDWAGDRWKQRFDFLLNNEANFPSAGSDTLAKYRELFANVKVRHNTSEAPDGYQGTFPVVEAISGWSHSGIINVPSKFVLYRDWDSDMMSTLSEDQSYGIGGYGFYTACPGCFETTVSDENRAYAVFLGRTDHKKNAEGKDDTSGACIFLAGDANLFENFYGGAANFGTRIAPEFLKVAKSAPCGYVSNSAKNGRCDRELITVNPVTGEEGCCDVSNTPAKNPDGEGNVCCPAENICNLNGVSTCWGEYRIGEENGSKTCCTGLAGLNSTGDKQICCEAEQKVAAKDGKCCIDDNISDAGTCCVNAAKDENGKTICCDGENQAIATVGVKKRCYDKSLVTSTGELCLHGKDGDKCAKLTSHICPVPEEHKQQQVLFLSTAEWTAEESLVDICTSPTNRPNEVDKEYGIAGCVAGSAGVDCSKRQACIEACTTYVTSDWHDKPKSEWKPGELEEDKTNYDNCRKVAFDTERVELEKRRGDFFVNNAYDAFESVIGKDNMIDRRGISDKGLKDGALSTKGWVTSHKDDFDKLPKGSVVVIATEYRPMDTTNADELRKIMEKRGDLTFVIFADGCRTCHRQFPSMEDKVNAGAGVSLEVFDEPQPAVLLPAEGDSNLQQFVNIINNLGTKVTGIDTRSRVGEIFGRKPSTQADSGGNPFTVGVGNELRHYSFELKKGSAKYESLFAGLPAMFGYNPSAIVNLPAGYALYSDLTNGEIDIGKNLIKYQDCQGRTCGDTWTGGYVSNQDYRKGLPKAFDYGSDESTRAVAMFISHDDYNDKENPGSCVFLAGDLSFFDRHGEGDLSQIDHTKQHKRIAATLLNAALSDKCTRPPLSLTCETSGGCADSYTEYKEDSEDKCCAPELTAKNSSTGAFVACCTDTGITTKDKTACCEADNVLKDADKNPLKCCEGDTPKPATSEKDEPVCCSEGQLNDANVCCDAGKKPAKDKESGKPVCCAGKVVDGVCEDSPPGPSECPDGKIHVPDPDGACCWKDVDKRDATCEGDQTPDKVCCKPGGCSGERLPCKEGQIVDGECGCKCNMPYESRPYCEDGQLPAPYEDVGAKSGSKDAVYACCKPRPSTASPVPTAGWPALLGLGALLPLLARRQRRQSKRRDDDA